MNAIVCYCLVSGLQAQPAISATSLAVMTPPQLNNLTTVSNPQVTAEAQFRAAVQASNAQAAADLKAQEAAQAALEAQKVSTYQSAPKTSYTAPDDSYKAFIYAHESGNNPWSVNRYSGACGLGQSLPCSKMGCALGDYGCQDAYFTSYMLGRYGSWYNAYAYWLSHSWW